MLTIPDKLKRPLERSAFEAATLHFAEASWAILKDNQMPFFPAYTDHGCDHIQCVLDAAVLLIPDDVWAQDLIQPADASVLICSTLLHDLALHVRVAGFMEIIAPSSPFKPLHWFDTVQATRSPDNPWQPLWNAFRKEARHFTKSQLDRLLGPEHGGVPWIAFGDTTPDPSTWTEADRLLVGEFLRRHHARLAHEIAMYGFPGATAETYPRLGEAMPDLANAIGLVARSHNEPMRTCLDYLDYLQPGNRRPFGALVPYLIGLIRIADYFQLEAKRAPPLLLHLKDPQSPQSIEEWNKHGAVGPISWSVTDPLAVYIETVPAHGLRTHLQLSELFGDLQQELDTTTAVLSETYPMPPLSSLRLARQRIRTNLDEPSFHAELSYVPKKASLRSAEDLFRLVVGDLYGNQPAVAGRELIQNAVDAVRERRRWESHFGSVTDNSLFREQRADVQVTLLKEPTGISLCVADRGIGMTAEATIAYFLTAGATFSLLENDANSDRAIAISHLKAGRFGIGAFAAFLLGPEMRVTTRHIGADRGITFVARIDDDLVQLDWADAPFGTEVVVPFSPGSELAELDGSSLIEFFARIHSFYRLPDPTIAFELVRPDAETMTWDGLSDVPVPSSDTPPPDEWRSISAAGFDHVSWRAAEPDHDFIYDGIGVEDPATPAGGRAIYRWSDRQIEQLIKTPDLAVFDSRHLLGISLNRYQLSERTLPFEESLLYSIGLDIVAYALVAATTEHVLGKGWGLKGVFTKDSQLPFLPGLLQRYLKTDLCVLWLSPDSYHGMERPLIDNSLFWLPFPTRVALKPPRKLHRRAWEPFDRRPQSR